ncbi:magnesium transporter CorA family protein [Planococcus lenghuensis]|uniref:Mg2+ transporter protein, CorA-like protein n=1 Tax=Planococcus lenghuensis TaxID=2213202 RepID=A0A1Q2KYU9_9BACL|nr:magnesium transporter CorA family protein [Planococcus lenghuensis]AQQ53371.1 hypothetical protein B0X71_09980 [Planococcus lenghuensis]
MEKYSFSNDKWQWYGIDPASDEDVQSLPPLADPCRTWLQSLKEDQNNNLEMETTEEGKEALWGSIIYHQNLDKQEGQTILHYCLLQNTLVTNKLAFSRLYHSTEQKLFEKLQQAENAIEGFMILLGEIVASFLQDIDAFEDRMHKLLWRLKENNNEDVLEQIIANRHEILVWENLIIPVIEIQDAMKEAFGDEIADGWNYKRTSRRISRCNNIIQLYDDEIQQMTALENVLSNYRGNNIFKTLTVITLLFTPLTAWGALWGMNFEVMPELSWQYGYLFAIALILFTTGGLFYYLQRKKWMGDILKSGNRKEF